jgi:hypothetical protein
LRKNLVFMVENREMPFGIFKNILRRVKKEKAELF